MQHHATKSHSAPRMRMLHHASAAHAPNHTSTPYMGASPCERACTYAMHACRTHAPHAHAHLHALSPVDRLHCRVRHMIQVPCSPTMALGRHNCLAADALVRCAGRVGCGCCTTVASLRRKALRWSQQLKAWRSRYLHVYLDRALKLARTHLQAGNVRFGGWRVSPLHGVLRVNIQVCSAALYSACVKQTAARSQEVASVELATLGQNWPHKLCGITAGCSLRGTSFKGKEVGSLLWPNDAALQP